MKLHIALVLLLLTLPATVMAQESFLPLNNYDRFKYEVTDITDRGFDVTDLRKDGGYTNVTASNTFIIEIINLISEGSEKIVNASYESEFFDTVNNVQFHPQYFGNVFTYTDWQHWETDFPRSDLDLPANATIDISNDDFFYVSAFYTIGDQDFDLTLNYSKTVGHLVHYNETITQSTGLDNQLIIALVDYSTQGDYVVEPFPFLPVVITTIIILPVISKFR